MTPFGKFLHLPFRDQLLLAEAVLYLALARLLVRTVPFRRLVPYLGAHNLEAPDIQDARMLALADNVGWSLQVAARYVPWQAVCLPSAIAAKLMLRRRGIPSTLCLGVHTAQTRLEAHAWLRVGSHVITGEHERAGCTAVSLFGA